MSRRHLRVPVSATETFPMPNGGNEVKRRSMEAHRAAYEALAGF